jgi:hypothetical protein
MRAMVAGAGYVWLVTAKLAALAAGTPQGEDGEPDPSQEMGAAREPPSAR